MTKEQIIKLKDLMSNYMKARGKIKDDIRSNLLAYLCGCLDGVSCFKSTDEK